MILVTDAQLRHSLAVIRSLGRKGIPVLAGDCERISTGFFSKYATEKIIYPDPKEKEEDFLEFIFELVQKRKIEMIIPVSDEALLALAKEKQNLEKYTILPIGDYQTIIKARDKGITLQIAKEIGLPIPLTYYPKSERDLEDIKKYPVLIKPRFSCGSRGISLCKNLLELKRKFKKTSEDYGPLLIQEYIKEGEEIGYYALFGKDSRSLAFTIQKRIRSYPVSGGPSTLRETILYPQIKDLGENILKHLNWQGVAMVEFKIDKRDNIPKLMEVNPRFWGSLALSIAAGVDFPFLLYQLYVENKIPLTTPQYKTGVRCRWLLPGDILWFLGAEKSWLDIKEFFKFSRAHYDIISWDDPKPILGFFLASLTYLFSKKKLKYVFKRGF